MPLILFTGFPCSGKTTKAKELINLLQKKIDSDPSLSKYNIIYHNDESLGIQHNDYISSQDERSLRSKITSVVKRDLSKFNIVVIDSLNYIKGFRYQLHCEVKNLSTSFILIQTMCPVDTVIEWNKKSSESRIPWDNELLTQLIQRYEEPNSQNRWDSPLYPIFTPTDSFTDTILQDFYSILFNKRDKSSVSSGNDNNSVQKPNNVTVLKPAKKSNFIQLLDIETSKVIKKIIDTIKEKESIGVPYQGTRIIIIGNDINDDNCKFITLPFNKLTLPKLQRIKRQFIMLNKLRDIELDRIIPLFIDYLNINLAD